MSACEECGNSFGCMGKATPCAKCNKLLCRTCSGKYPLIPFDPKVPEDDANDISKNGVIKIYCKPCFQEVSILDFSKNEEEFKPKQAEGQEESSTNDTITFVMAHGGGGCRAMFRPHAKLLAERGYRCILIDLPGHGTLVETPLTLDACVDRVKGVLDKYGLTHTNDSSGSDSKSKTIYVGASFGAYTGFYVLDKLKDQFCGAVQMDCGQNVGPGASLKARAGMWMLKKIAQNLSNHGMFGAMLDVSKKSPADYKLIESTFGAGFFFEQGVQQAVCLQSVAPAEHIPNYDFPVLYFNGSEDYRDSENKWLSLCKDQEKSSLKVFQGGDHFFCHDSRFVNEIIDLMDNFAKSVA